MLRYISADWIFPVSAPPLKNGVLALDKNGRIEALFDEEESKRMSNVEYHTGILVPGFINTHCHLELSHLRDKIPTGTGLTGFIKDIVALRSQPADEVQAAMAAADDEMYRNGIVAVADISNAADSKTVKLKSKLYYHTLIELYGFNRPSLPIIENALQLKREFEPLKTSLVPHAPYSVWEELFEQIRLQTHPGDLLSIHNQETDAENELFEKGTGKFADFLAKTGIAQSKAHGSTKSALHYHLSQLAKNVNTLLVHNTFSRKADIDFAATQHEHLYWCLCPNANRYIEQTLPDVDLFRRENLNITLGTDSLASNRQLSILAEMLVLQEQKNVPFEELLTWATLNGTRFMRIDGQYGSFEPGKQPGIVLIENMNDGRITEKTTVKRLI